jgi:hypothetical protein
MRVHSHLEDTNIKQKSDSIQYRNSSHQNLKSKVVNKDDHAQVETLAKTTLLVDTDSEVDRSEPTENRNIHTDSKP